jgi:hypothetical protein
MPLETAAGIWDLNSSNPPSGDTLAQADDHLRLIKAAILATFPNINSALTPTDEVINDLADRVFQFADGSSGAPSVQIGTSGTQGFYKNAAGQVGISGRLIGNGAVSVGSVQMFPKTFTGLGTSTGAGFTHLECNGATYNNSDYPDLATFLGQGGSTFVVPNMTDTGRFPRSRTGSLTVGSTQSNQNAAHTHTVSGTVDSDGAHAHTASSVVTDPGHVHSVQYSVGNANGCCGLTTSDLSSTGSAHNTQSATTGISVATTVNSGGAHVHTFSATTASSGSSEARPEAIAFIFAIKT